jgi:predicted nucleic acid-binding protein
MYLLDTNIFLEALLEQDRTDEVKKLFSTKPLDDFYITDFSLHSIGIILFRLKQPDLYNSFVKDLVLDGLGILTLRNSELLQLSEIADKFQLDFDDAYQYVSAKKYDLQLISFDQDFDKTDIQRREPIDVLVS